MRLRSDPLRALWYWVADGWERSTDSVRTLWGRTTDRILTWWDRVVRRIVAPWDWFADSVAGGRRRLTDGLWALWYRSVDRIKDLGPGTKALIAGLPLVIVASVLVLSRADAPDVPEASSENDPISRPGSQGRASGDTTEPEDPLPGVNVEVNDQAGYLFSYPDGWDLSTSGTTTALLDREGQVTISFGIAPPGTLAEASDLLVEELTGSYTGVRLVTDEIQRTAQGHRSLVVGGEGTDASGDPVSFVVVTIRGPDENNVISIRFGPGSEPLDALPAIQEIIASFRISAAA